MAYGTVRYGCVSLYPQIIRLSQQCVIFCVVSQMLDIFILIYGLKYCCVGLINLCQHRFDFKKPNITDWNHFIRYLY